MVSPRGLVGRSAALDQLADALSEVALGVGRLLVVSGEAGMGKTALLGATAAQAAGRGFRVYRAQCLAGTGAPPLWPWSRVLRALSADELVPDSWLLDRLGPTVPAGRDPSSPAADRFRLSEAMASELERRAAAQPLLIMVDDAQWSDQESLQLLGFLARRLVSAKVLLLAATRVDELPEELPGTTESLYLMGLDRAGVQELIARTQGSRPPPDVVDAVVRRSGGNPFFVRELTRLALAHGGWIDAEAGSPRPVSATIAATIRERLRALPAECRQLLEIVAVVGTAVEDGLLADLLALPGHEVERRAEVAVLAHVLIRHPSESSWTFCHDLYREVIVADLAPARRRELHASIGLALTRFRQGGEPVPASVVAQHLAEGGDSVRDLARRYATTAAADACYRYAYHDAARQLSLALRLSAEDDQVGRQDILVDLAAAQRRAGDREAAASSLRRVLGAASDPLILGRAALGLVELEIRSGSVDDENLAILRSAIDGIEQSGLSADALLARLYAALARELVHADTGRQARPEQAAERAVTLAVRAGDPQARAAALLAQHDAAWQPGSGQGRLSIIERLAEAATEAGDADLLAEATGLRGAALIESGDPRGVHELRRFVERSDRLGHARGHWVARARRATLAALAGELVQAEEHARSALSLGTEVGVPDALGCFGTTMISIALQGRPVPVELPDDDDPVAPLRPMLAALLDPDHDHRAAVSSVPVATLPRSPHLEASAIAAAAYAEWGEPEQCRALYDRLVRFAGTHVVIGGGAAYYGPVDYYLGRLAEAVGDRVRAGDHLITAGSLARRLGAVGWADLARARAEHHVLTGPSLHQIGDTWQLNYQGRLTYLPDAKGLHDLALLLKRPDVDVHVFTLLGRDVPPAGADPVLDDEAKRRYRQRIAELEVAATDADLAADVEASKRVAAEQLALRRELATAVGLRGRDRWLGDEVERARKTVSARVRDVLGRIDAADPGLAAYLRSTVSLGRHCVYRPDGGAATESRSTR